MDRIKEGAARQGRAIISSDESDLFERPGREREWAHNVGPPLLQYLFSCKQVSDGAGTCYWLLIAIPSHGSLKIALIVECLKTLQATVDRRELLINSDRLKAHRLKLVRANVEAQHACIILERLPVDAPELNHAECIWGSFKHHSMPNGSPANSTDLTQFVPVDLRSIQRRASLATAFGKQAALS